MRRLELWKTQRNRIVTPITALVVTALLATSTTAFAVTQSDPQSSDVGVSEDMTSGAQSGGDAPQNAASGSAGTASATDSSDSAGAQEEQSLAASTATDLSLKNYIAVAIGEQSSGNDDAILDLTGSKFGYYKTPDWGGNMALTGTGGQLESDESSTYASAGIVSRSDGSKFHVDGSSKWYPDQSTSSESMKNSYIQDEDAMDALNTELQGMKTWIAGLPVDDTTVTLTSSKTINVDNYDKNGDGIAVMQISKSQHIDEKTIVVSGSGKVLPIFLMASGTDLQMEVSTIKLGGELSTATGANSVGALFVQLDALSKEETFFTDGESKLDRVGFYDLTLNPTGPQVIEIHETTGCAQFVGTRVVFEDSTFGACTFGGATPSPDPDPDPTPDPDAAQIWVYVGTDRIYGYEGDATPLAGVRLRLGSGQGDTTSWASYDWATCESGADGWCVFTIPIVSSTGSSGMKNDQKPWVSSLSTPAGWSNFETYYASGVKKYSFKVDKTLKKNDVIKSTDAKSFMRQHSTTKDLESFGQWATIRDNPDTPEKCGLDIAFVTDLSSSISSSDLVQAKKAMDDTIDELVGSASRIALFSFDRKSPASNGTEYPEPLPVKTASEASTVKALYKDWKTGSGTNWDTALYSPAAASPHYDLVIFLTDGSPTWWGVDGQIGPGEGPVTNLEAPIFSANLLKSQGTRVVAFGVGSALNHPNRHINLQVVSGTTLGEDFFVAPDYAEAGKQMAALVSTCDSGIEVEKRVINQSEEVPANATPAQLDAISAPAENWQISAAVESGDLAFNSSNTSWPTNADGLVSTVIKYAEPDGTGKVAITETQQEEFDIVPVNGSNLVCTDKDSGSPVVVDSISDSANPGGSVSVAVGQDIKCVLYNGPVKGEITWEKVDQQGTNLGRSEWKITGPSPTTTETTIEDCVADLASSCTGNDKDHRKGHFLVEGLALGSYTLVETKAPAGYQMDTNPRPFTITSASPKFEVGKIENKLMSVPVLPLTGGVGEQAFLLTGLFAAIAALVGTSYQVISRRRN